MLKLPEERFNQYAPLAQNLSVVTSFRNQTLYTDRSVSDCPGSRTVSKSVSATGLVVSFLFVAKYTDPAEASPIPLSALSTASSTGNPASSPGHGVFPAARRAASVA